MLTMTVRAYVVQAKTGKTGARHLFRHTMATLMLEGGADIRFIQEMLGHARLDTTQIYTRVSIRTLKQIHSASHPAAMLKREHGGDGEAMPVESHCGPVNRLRLPTNCSPLSTPKTTTKTLKSSSFSCCS